MRILILSYYFRPDLSAGSFRATALVDALQRLAPAGTAIDVVTTLPHRYHSFSAFAEQDEQVDGVTIHRIALPRHKGGLLDQSRAFAVFSARTAAYVRKREYDVVFATSSRLMTGVLGSWVARRKKARLFLDLRDMFVDSISEVLQGGAGRIAQPVLARLEKSVVRSAQKVNLVSPGFRDYFETLYAGQTFSYITNGIDPVFTAAAPMNSRPLINEGRPLKVIYAGNLGEGQGLHRIVPMLGARTIGRLEFQIIGEGARADVLRRAISEAAAHNVTVSPPMERCDLLRAYEGADILFLHLNDWPTFEKVLPSKIFEYGALGKPIWAGVAGYAAEFLRNNVDNVAVFKPCDVDGALRVLDDLRMVEAPRRSFIDNFARERTSAELAAAILEMAT